MKRLMFLFCLLASFIACSDDKEDPVEPKVPITDLQLPTVNPVAGDDVTIAGKGFTQDCKVQVKPEGAVEGVEVTIVEITDAGITFKVPAEVAGKCTVILLQGGKSYELGELTIDEIPEVESTLYGVFQEGTSLVVCPIDVEKQRKGKALFSLEGADYIDGIVADNQGKVYWKAVVFEGVKIGYELRYYDVKNGKGGKIAWEGANQCFSIGTSGEGLLALTYDSESYEIVCYAVELDGTAEELIRWEEDEVSNYTRVTSTGGTFSVEDLDDYALLYLGVTVETDGDGSQGGGAIVAYDDGYSLSRYQDCDRDKDYCFVNTGKDRYVFKSQKSDPNIEEDDNNVQKFSTTIHKVRGADMESWVDDGNMNPQVGEEIENVYTNQVYDPSTGLIYGMYGEEYDGILPFDPKTDKTLDPWMGSGCTALLYIPAWE